MCPTRNPSRFTCRTSGAVGNTILTNGLPALALTNNSPSFPSACWSVGAVSPRFADPAHRWGFPEMIPPSVSNAGSRSARRRRKFSSRADPEVLEGLHQIAEREGRQFEAVLGEAMREYLVRKRQQAPRPNVLEAFQHSLQERDELFRALAK
jgi:hypothetical protein